MICNSITDMAGYGIINESLIVLFTNLTKDDSYKYCQKEPCYVYIYIYLSLKTDPIRRQEKQLV